MTRFAFVAAFVLTAGVYGGQAIAEVPAAIAAPGEKTVATFHAVGAQIYECKAGADGKLSWSFREPIAALLLNGKTVGRHFAGPTWEDADGSAVVGKVAGNAPGASPDDVAWLKLNVVSRHGKGKFSPVTTVQRINTQGGNLKGSCDQAGELRAVPYSADYVLLRKK
jgi:hypothetical protein